MTEKPSLTGTTIRLLIVATGLLLLVGCGGGSSTSTSTTPTTPATNNTVPLTVGFGPNGQAGGYTNGVFTTVTVCAPNTSNCQVIDNVLVDTGSIGLRILNSALTTVPQSSLGSIQDNTSDQLQECVQYGDTSYSWGPMWVADVEMGGEKASGIAIQVIGGNSGNATFGTVPSQCLVAPVNSNLPNGGNEDTVTTLGANGILGIGIAANDCGNYCTSSGSLSQSGYPYYVCPTGQACSAVTVPVQYQATNPVAAFSSSDNNGIVVTLPAIGAQGAASDAGTIAFGIGTQTDNTISGQTLYAMDPCGLFPTATFNGVAYSDTYCSNGSGSLGAFLDTGTNTNAVSDAATLSSLGISDCAQGTAGFNYYCVSGGGTATLSNIALTGYNSVGSGSVSINIADATTLFTANPSFAAFDNVGSDSGTNPTNDYFDFGLPFFIGRTVFFGIGGTAVPNGATAPYGYVAF